MGHFWTTFGSQGNLCNSHSWSSWLFGPERIYIYICNNNTKKKNKNNNNNNDNQCWKAHPSGGSKCYAQTCRLDHCNSPKPIWKGFIIVSLIGSLPILQCPSTLAGSTGKPMVSGGAFPARSSSAAVEEGFAPEISSRWAWQGSSGTCFAVPARK